MSLLSEGYRARARLHSDVEAHMAVFYAWAHNSHRIIELGVRGGNSTNAFLAGLDHGGGPGELWSVDINEPQVPPFWHDLEFWHLYVGDDRTAEAVEFCPDAVDVLFIDTSHFYEHTLAELELYSPKVRKGGVILMHDTGPGDWPDVARALDVWCAQTRHEWYNHPVWPGLGLVEV